jgi:hypothetical protein
MMNGQWFKEIFLYNESFSKFFLKSFVFKLPNVFLTLALYKALVKKLCRFQKLTFSASGVYREDLSHRCHHYSEKYVWLRSFFYFQFQCY